MSEFIPFPKIPRYSRNVIVTEKIDGTNAQVFIRRLPDTEVMPTETPIVAVHGDLLIYAGSRNRWITPEDDNAGFARWVKENAQELSKLGEGAHFGEWWGAGIQRRYGLDHKRFSLFNTARWSDERGERPVCCHVVPVLWHGSLDDLNTQAVLDSLATGGSMAAPGFMKPEGIVIFHGAAKQMFKRTIDKDDEPKGARSEAA